MGFSSDSADKELIRDSSDSNPRFYNVTCAGESQRGLHIEKWEFSDTSWCRCSAYLLQLYFSDLSSRTRGLNHRMIMGLLFYQYLYINNMQKLEYIHINASLFSFNEIIVIDSISTFQQKMGLLTDPKRQKKIIEVISKYNNLLCVLCYLSGVLGFLALAYQPLNGATYFSENALLPGKV